MSSAGPLKKLVDWFQGYDEEDEEFGAVDATPASPPPAAAPKRQRGPLVLHTGGEGGMEIRHPRSLDERMTVGMDLKQRRMVTLDLTLLPEADARYFLEFIYGVVFALDATAEKVTDGIYMLAPRGVEVRNDVEAAAAPTASSPLISTLRSTARLSGSRGDQEELFWQGR